MELLRKMFFLPSDRTEIDGYCEGELIKVCHKNSELCVTISC